MKTMLLFLAVSVSSVKAEGRFSIVEGLSNGPLKEVMEGNVNEMMTTFNAAASLDAKSLKLSKTIFTPEAIKEIGLVWKGSTMVFPPVNIKSRCLTTNHGYQVRGIPVDITEADEAEKRQELTIDFTPDGKISNVSIAIEMHR